MAIKGERDVGYQLVREVIIEDYFLNRVYICLNVLRCEISIQEKLVEDQQERRKE